MSPYEQKWNNFQAAWSDIPVDQRLQLLRENLSANCVYTDPNGVAQGWDQLAERIQRTQQQFPGASFTGDTFAFHHARAMSTWTMRSSQGEPIFLGKSFARFDDEGQLTEMTGFFEPVG